MAMKWLAVSVKDVRAGTFGTPYFVPNEGVALRTFANEVNRAEDKNVLFTNPEDFEVYAVGHFDDESGFWIPELYEGKERPRLIALAKELKRTMQ